MKAYAKEWLLWDAFTTIVIGLLVGVARWAFDGQFLNGFISGCIGSVIVCCIREYRNGSKS